MTKLYHARRAPEAEQTSLFPTTNPAQQRNDRFGQFLFATHRLDQAYLYALPFPGPGTIGPSFMSTLDPRDPESALTRFRGDRTDKIRSEVFSNKIYSMDSAGFEQVTKNPREWINDQAVHDVELVDHVTEVNQALKKGVQYFSMANHAPVVSSGAEPFHALQTYAKTDSLTAEVLAKAISSDPHIVWENEVDGFGVDPKLSRLVDASRLALLEEKIGQPLGSEALSSLAQSFKEFKGRSPRTPDQASSALTSAVVATLSNKDSAPNAHAFDHSSEGFNDKSHLTARPHDERMIIKDALSMVHAILEHFAAPLLSAQSLKSLTEHQIQPLVLSLRSSSIKENMATPASAAAAAEQPNLALHLPPLDIAKKRAQRIQSAPMVAQHAALKL